MNNFNNNYLGNFGGVEGNIKPEAFLDDSGQLAQPPFLDIEPNSNMQDYNKDAKPEVKEVGTIDNKVEDIVESGEFIDNQNKKPEIKSDEDEDFDNIVKIQNEKLFDFNKENIELENDNSFNKTIIENNIGNINKFSKFNSIPLDEKDDPIDPFTEEKIIAIIEEDMKILAKEDSFVEGTEKDDYIDSSLFDLMQTFLQAEFKFREKILSNERINEFFYLIQNTFKAQALAELGKKRIEMIEKGLVSEKELEFVEAEICILFTQLMKLRKIKYKDYNNADQKQDNPMSMNVYNDYTYQEEKQHEEPERTMTF